MTSPKVLQMTVLSIVFSIISFIMSNVMITYVTYRTLLVLLTRADKPLELAVSSLSISRITDCVKCIIVTNGKDVYMM